MEGLGSIRELQIKESEASGKISGLERKIQYAEIEKVIKMNHGEMHFNHVSKTCELSRGNTST